MRLFHSDVQEWQRYPVGLPAGAATRSPFRTAHAAATDWRDGYLTVTMGDGCRGTI